MHQKINNFLAIVQDCGGFHWTARALRNNKVSVGECWFLIATLPAMPASILINTILTRRIHKPNCNCEDGIRARGK